VARRESAGGPISPVIVLDTNIVSELMRAEPDGRVASCLDGFPRQELAITAISIFELRFGIELHAEGRRRGQLGSGLERILETGFGDRVLTFDTKAAAAAARLSPLRRQLGRSIEIRDALIAGIVISQRAAFATRNVRHFQDLDMRLIDPWTDRSF
jgi:toxin FitB